MSGGTVFAVPFDLRSLTVTGGAVPVIEGVSRSDGGDRRGPFCVLQVGVGGLCARRVSDTASVGRVRSQRRRGRAQTLTWDISVSRGSPRTARRSRSKRAMEKKRSSRFTSCPVTAPPRRLTFGGNNRFPVWSADGRRVTFQSDREGDPAIFWQPADGGTAERLTTPARGTSHAPESWSPDGQVLLFSESEGLHLVALDILAARSKSVAVQRRQGFDASNPRHLFARRSLGGLSGRREWPGRSDAVRSALPADGHEVSDRARRPASLVS